MHSEEAVQQMNRPVKDTAMCCCVWQYDSEPSPDSQVDTLSDVYMRKKSKTCSGDGGHLPIVSSHYLEDSLLHVFKWYGLHVGVRRTSLLGRWGSEVIHHFFQFKKEVVLKLRPLNPAGTQETE